MITRRDFLVKLAAVGVAARALDGGAIEAAFAGPAPPPMPWPTGTFLHLDAGMLDLGLVRDSVMDSTSDYVVFSETFENVASRGLMFTTAVAA